jgi:hypothetical protein
MSSIKIEHFNKIVPDAYHGTSKANADKIIKSGFEISIGDDQYLGQGVYFFEGSRSSAERWANRSYHLPDCAVIQAMLNLGRCLDFHIPEHVEFIILAKDEILKRQAALPGTNPEKRKIITDGVVVNFLAKLAVIDTVRASQIIPKSKKPLIISKTFPGSHFYNPQLLIICVRNLASIVDLKIV